MSHPGVFAGVIKGSEHALLFENGYLDRQAYLTLSARMYPVFQGHRDKIYSLFECYIKRKRERREYDAPDRLVIYQFE